MAGFTKFLDKYSANAELEEEAEEEKEDLTRN